MRGNRTKRRTCGEAGGVARSGQPCASVWVNRVTGLYRAHDPAQAEQRAADTSKGGRRSHSSRLSKRMQRLVTMLFSERESAPTLERIEPLQEYDRECPIHILRVEGMTAMLGGHGRSGLMCMGYRCQDQSPFAKAMRILRIREGNVDDDGHVTYSHVDTGTTIPRSEIARVERLVKGRA